MEMIGGSSVSYLARTPCVPLSSILFKRVETEGLLDYQVKAGIFSIVWWNLRPVLFGVEKSLSPYHKFQILNQISSPKNFNMHFCRDGNT